MTDQEIYQAAINKFGSARQIDKLIEEMSELTKELMKIRYDKTYNQDLIISEIADVEIVLSQIKIIFDPFKVDQHKENKLNRLKSIL